MQVETYLLEENEDVVFNSESLEEWKEKIESLKLEGQQKLIAGENYSPTPFKLLNREELNVFQTLFRNTENIKDYSASTIPLKVLGLIALSEKEGYFKRIEIWYDNAVPDPLVVGVREDPDRTWMEYRYLLARFGDHLPSYEEMKESAKKRWISFRKQALEQLKAEVENYTRTIETDADAFVNGASIMLPSYRGF